MSRCVTSFVHGFFVLDHNNYTRWLPIHVRYMVELAVKHPAVYEEYLKGNFVVQKILS